MLNKKILFITGTRADFGKISPLISKLQDDEEFDFHIFVTGMHLLEKYGNTFIEVQRTCAEAMTLFRNQPENSQLSMDLILAETIKGLNECVTSYKPDLIIVHGDRAEALAGAIVGSLNNILTAHIEGGELSGTIDELIRHSITKLAHIHFAANETAQRRLLQLGEASSSISIIGSPDIDIMLSDDLPTLEKTYEHYEIDFDSFAIFCYHPVTTELAELENHMKNIVQALESSGDNYIVIDSNNDPGREIIADALDPLRNNSRFRFYPSLNHGHYLTLLNNCMYLMGNTSSCVREAPVYATPSINLGTRQNNRHKHSTIIDAREDVDSILTAITIQKANSYGKPSFYFGSGGSAEKFIHYLKDPAFWECSVQKQFRDMD